MKTISCAFTGHRPQSLPFGFNETDSRCIALKMALHDQIINLIETNGVTHFISGMAIGVDMFAAEIVLGLKAIYPNITLECAFPCETQAAKWSENLRNRHFDIASKCDKETLILSNVDALCCVQQLIQNEITLYRCSLNIKTASLRVKYSSIRILADKILGNIKC